MSHVRFSKLCGYLARSEDKLELSAKVEENRTSSWLLKAAYNSLPNLLQSCRETATSMKGEEAVFAVISMSDEWMQEEWANFIVKNETIGTDLSGTQDNTEDGPAVLGRRLVESIAGQRWVKAFVSLLE